MCGPSLHLTEGHEPIEPGQGRMAKPARHPLAYPSGGCYSPDRVRIHRSGMISPKGQIIQAAQHPRTFGWGYIDPASTKLAAFGNWMHWVSFLWLQFLQMDWTPALRLRLFYSWLSSWNYSTVVRLFLG